MDDPGEASQARAPGAEGANGHGDPQSARVIAEAARERADGAAGDGTPGGNGNGHAGAAAGARGGGLTALPGRVLGGVAGWVASRVPAADLDERDPDYIRESLPRLWLLCSLWFRGEVRGLGNIPEKGPVLLVGNHSGGNMTPDTLVFTLAFSTYFGVERVFHQLAHNLVVSIPFLSPLRKFGTVAASRDNARKALRSGAAVLVYPGGDYDVFRPSWQSSRIDFGGRKGFIELAIDEGVPIVPVVSIGGQETALFLSRGEHLAKALMLDKMFRLKALSISLAVPWGLNIGDMAGHLPLPAKITVEALHPIDLREEFGEDPDPEEVHDHLVRVMQETLDALAAERRLPLLG